MTENRRHDDNVYLWLLCNIEEVESHRTKSTNLPPLSSFRPHIQISFYFLRPSCLRSVGGEWSVEMDLNEINKTPYSIQNFTIDCDPFVN